MSEKECPQCGGDKFVRDYVRGDLICKGCGFVLEEQFIDTGPDWYAQKEEKKHTGPPVTETAYDLGISSKIDRRDRDATGRKLKPSRVAAFKRLRRVDQRAHMTNSERTLARALQEQSRMCYNLGLPRLVRERSALLFRKIVKTRTLRGRSVEAVAAAAVYLACKEFGIGKDMDELIKESGVEPKKFKGAYYLLVRQFHATPSQIEVAYFIHDVAKRLGLSDDLSTAITERLRGQRTISKRLAQEQVAVSIYEECRRAGRPVTQAKIAEALNFSRASLSKLINAIRAAAKSSKKPV